MIFELLYTSAPKGLKPGAKGYCTVLTTEGIPSALLERLEGYCGYRHLFSPGSPDNPEAFGHRILNLAGNTWHILSRVADAGSDYSGRSNLIGHFMAISEDELKGISAGPTSLMMSDGFFRTVLEGEPRRVSESETRKRLGNLTDKTQQALTWAKVTGHAGWAGRLVQVTEETSDSIALVYPLRTKTLKLLDEAASILPKYKQWDITFNTFFTKSGEECRWRCYCADVTEAGPFKGGEFDLVEVKRIGEPPVDSPYAEAATNGKNKVGASPAAKPASGAKARTPIKPNSEKSLEAGQSFADKRQAKRDLDKIISGAVEETKQSSVKPTQQSLEVLPRQAGPLPPPVNRATWSIDLLNDVINEGKNPRNRKSQSRDPFKIAFIVTAVLLVSVVFIFALIEIIRSKPNTAVVGIPKGDAKKAEPIDKPIDVLLTVKPPEKKGDSTAAEKKADDDKKLAAEKKAADEKLAAEKKAADEKLAAEKKVADEKLAAEKKAADLKAKTLTDAKNPSDATGMAPNGSGTKEAVVNVNALTEIVAREEIEGNLIVPLDKFLKEKSKNKVDFEKIVKEGITVKFPDKIKFEVKPDIKYLCKSAKKIAIDQVTGSKINIKIPSDLENSEIENFTFAFSRISLTSKQFIQFFEPIELSKKELAGGPQKITFITAEKTKADMIRKFFYDKKGLEQVEIGYHSSSQNFYIGHNKNRIKDLIENTKDYRKAGKKYPIDYAVLVIPDIDAKSGEESVLQISRFIYFVPMTFLPRHEVQKKYEDAIKNSRPRNLEEKDLLKIWVKNYDRYFAKIEGKNEYVEGEYFFEYESNMDSNKPEQQDAKIVHDRLRNLKLELDEIKAEQDTFHRPMLRFLNIKYDNNNVNVESGKVLQQFKDQIKTIQGYLEGSIPKFYTYFAISWKTDEGMPDNEKLKEYYKDAKVIVYSYKQPK